MMVYAEPHTRRTRIIRIIVLIGALPLVAPLVILAIGLRVIYLSYGLVLHTIIWRAWCSQGIHVLFVYSNSPIWKDYIETGILPRLPPGAHVLNWSDRKKWRFFSFPVLVFRFFAGPAEFNPMAIVFNCFQWGCTYRFWKPFRDYKHGNETPLVKLQRDFLAAVGSVPVSPST